jgi:hypothetical protein
MKKIISRSLATILGITAFVSAYTQDVALNQKRIETGIISQQDQVQAEVPFVNTVNSKVLKSFRRSFGERPDARWSKSDNRFVVFLKDSTMSTHVYFKSNGELQYSVHYYSEDRLPQAIRHTVKSNFYDYSIIRVSEVRAHETVSYFVKIEDKTTIKTIRVDEQEWQIVEELEKQTSPATIEKDHL